MEKLLGVKDAFKDVYKNCPQDKQALIRFIMQVHTNQCIYNGTSNNVKHENVLLDGDFGIGKTTMAEEVAKVFGIPFYKFLFPKIGGVIDSGILSSVLNDIFENMYNENEHNKKLNGLIVIDELEKALNFDCLNMLDNIIGMKYYSLYDSNSELYINVDISNITFVGEINRDRTREYVTIPEVRYVSSLEIDESCDDDVVYIHSDEIEKRLKEADNKLCDKSSDSDFTIEEIKLEKILLQKAKKDLVEQISKQLVFSKVDEIINTQSRWHIFSNHIAFEDLSLESIVKILSDSEISEYKNLSSKLEADDYLELLDSEVVKLAAEMILNNPNKLYAITDVFYEIAGSFDRDNVISLYDNMPKTYVLKRDTDGRH